MIPTAQVLAECCGMNSARRRVFIRAADSNPRGGVVGAGYIAPAVSGAFSLSLWTPLLAVASAFS